MILEVINNKLKTNEFIKIVNTRSDIIGLVGEFPINSVIECVITGLKIPYKFYLQYVKTVNEGNVFSNNIILTDKILDYIVNLKNSSVGFTFIINKVPVEGIQYFQVNYDSLIKDNCINLDPNYEIRKQVNELNARVDSLLYGKAIDKKLIGSNISKGMIPISQGPDGSYIWDYPFTDLYTKVKELIILLNKLSQSNAQLTERLAKLEVEVTEEKYKKYTLV
ncbi:MAG TPA: hypothetical protein PK626_00650 [Bacteroidales bacterium]|nr:hypothetical protein [Bacteroidales bacterium]